MNANPRPQTMTDPVLVRVDTGQSYPHFLCGNRYLLRHAGVNELHVERADLPEIEAEVEDVPPEEVDRRYRERAQAYADQTRHIAVAGARVRPLLVNDNLQARYQLVLGRAQRPIRSLEVVS